MSKKTIPKNLQYYKFCSYGFLKNLRLFEPFLILFFLEKGLSYAQIGTIYAIREIARNMFEIPSGVMADIFGRRRTMIFSFSSYIISFSVFYLFDSFGLFIVAMIFYGFADAFRTGTHKAMIFEYLKIKKITNLKVHYYGHTRSWSQKGSALSSLIAATFVFFYSDYTTIFLITTIPYLLDLILIASYPKNLEGGYGNRGSGITIKESFINSFKDIKYSLKKSGAIKCVINVSIFSGYQKAIKDYIQPMIGALALSYPLLYGMDEKQQTAVFIGILYFIIYNFTSLASKQSGNLDDSRGNKALNITLLGGFFIGMTSGFFYGMEFMIPAIVFFIGIYIMENLRKPIGIAYISEHFDEHILASSLSLASQSETVFAAIFALMMGFLAEFFGVKWAILIISALLLIILPIISVKPSKSKIGERNSLSG